MGQDHLGLLCYISQIVRGYARCSAKRDRYVSCADLITVTACCVEWRKQLLDKLQRIQSMAARVVSMARRRHAHITPVLRAVHWLPIRQSIAFKFLLLVYKALYMDRRDPTSLTYC